MSETHKAPSPVSLGPPLNLSSSLLLRGLPFLFSRSCDLGICAQPTGSSIGIDGNVEGRQPSRNRALQDAFPVSSLSIIQTHT